MPTDMMPTDIAQCVGLYARVSGDHQVKEQTIASQLAALEERIAQDRRTCDAPLHFIDDGYRGSTLHRPALERLRDVAAIGGLDRLYVHSPDRLARKYAYQVVLVEELQRCGVEIVFLNQQLGTSPEEELLLQMQGMIAEYERAKIIERTRRGKRYAARRGVVNVLSAAPYGYRYITKSEGGGQAGYQVVLEEARVVRQVFAWVGEQRLSIREVSRRLARQGIPSPGGKAFWPPSTVSAMLGNPAYKGAAAFGKTRTGERQPRLRPKRGCAEQPRRPWSVHTVPPAEWTYIPVPSVVSEECFAAVGTKRGREPFLCRNRNCSFQHVPVDSQKGSRPLFVRPLFVTALWLRVVWQSQERRLGPGPTGRVLSMRWSGYAPVRRPAAV